MATLNQSQPLANALTVGKLPRWAPWAIAGICAAAAGFLFGMVAAAAGTRFNVAAAVIVTAIGFAVLLTVASMLVEGNRKAKDRLATTLVTSAFILALIPLISLIWTVLANGLARFDMQFFTYSMRGVVGAGGGAIHAIVGTLLITLMAAIISVPIGLMASIYLVEYGRGWLARFVTFFVDVMTGIPSIVAGLFAFALFTLIVGPGTKMGFAGSIALSVLMIPVVVRSSEEMLRLVPNELREASLALGVPKWRTVLKIVLPTSLAGITTGVMLAIARVIGETAPLLIVAGFTANMNYDLFSERMMTLPVFVYNQYANQGLNAAAYLDRAWAGALTLILIVMVLNLVARIIGKIFSPKLR